ncbi:MAG: hypothetical protein RI990_894 [Planctomycetota bacterium]
MGVQKTAPRSGRTLAHGSFEAREHVHVCLAGCRQPSGSKVTRRAACLSESLPPRQTVGYDVMVFAGVQRFVHHRQREEIREALLLEHGVDLSTGEVSILQRRFVLYLQRLHASRRDAIRQAFAHDGGWPLQIDATGEDGRGTLLIAYAGWRRWVLGSWKIPTEHADAILPCLHQVADAFGPPVAVVRDLGRAMTPAVLAFVETLDNDIPVLACHQHFLADVGNDLLERPHAKLRELFRRFKLRPGLRALVRALGRKLGGDVDRGRDAVAAWNDQSEAGHTVPDGNDGLAVVRALAQWVLDYAADGDDLGLPFDRPYLDLYDRCSEARRAADAFLRRPPEDQRVHRSLRHIRDILDPIVSEVPFSQVARTLRWRAGLFDELRDALRLVPKAKGRNPPTRAPAETTPPEQVRAALCDIRKAVEAFTADLRQRRPARGPAQDQRQAIDVILKHLHDHGPTLWGHVIALPETAGGGIRVVDRTNCRLESLNGDIKHGERRRSGRKKLTQDLENLPPGAPLAFNLHDPDYVDLLCASLERLPVAFAALDADTRSRTLDGLRIETMPALFDSPTATETASLPKRDRDLLRSKALRRRINDAANSRAPRTSGSHP